MYSKDNMNTQYNSKTDITGQNMNDVSKDETLQIKEEQLDIVKKWVQTGEVKVYRETFTEEKTFTIPVCMKSW
jgi:stress response protein YsnF